MKKIELLVPAKNMECLKVAVENGADSVYFGAKEFNARTLNSDNNFTFEELKEAIQYASQHIGMKDYKTVLQEKLQKNGDVHIEYNIIKEEGPDHDKIFTAEVKCDGKLLAIGKGKSKKMAEMQAAKQALEE